MTLAVLVNTPKVNIKLSKQLRQLKYLQQNIKMRFKDLVIHILYKFRVIIHQLRIITKKESLISLPISIKKRKMRVEMIKFIVQNREVQ